MVLFIGTGAHPARPRISTLWLSQVYSRDLWSAELRGNAEPDRSRPFTPRDESTAKDRDMVKLGYKLMAEEHGPSAPGPEYGARRAGRVRLRGDLRPFLPVARRTGSFTVRVVGARRRRRRH